MNQTASNSMAKGVAFSHGTMACRQDDNSHLLIVESVNVWSYTSSLTDAFRTCKREMYLIFIVSVDKAVNNCAEPPCCNLTDQCQCSTVTSPATGNALCETHTPANSAVKRPPYHRQHHVCIAVSTMLTAVLYKPYL